MDRDAIAELFAAFGPIDIRSMFGCAALYADGIFFALVEDGTVYLKADDETSPRFEAEGCRPFMYRARGRAVALSYWRMPERLYDDAEELASWARQACAAAVRIKARKRPSKAGTANPSAGKRGSPAGNTAGRGAVRRRALPSRAGIRGRSRK